VSEFEERVLTSLTKLETYSIAVEDHLGRLNSKVAKHEQQIGDLLLSQAREEGSAQTTAAWVNKLSPVAWLVGGVFLALVVTNIEQIKKFFIH
jgi:hypothetical protein